MKLSSSCGECQRITKDVQGIMDHHPQVPGLSLTVIDNFQPLSLAFGHARVSRNEAMTTGHYLQCASLSKTVAAAFAIEYFSARNIPMTTSVNSLLERYGSEWKIEVNPKLSLPRESANNVNLSMLVNHTALGMHYVYGIPLDRYVPTPGELVSGKFADTYNYQYLYLEREPGTKFSYSGGGFVVLQHLIELMEKDTIDRITRSFLDQSGLEDFTFVQLNSPLTAIHAYGHVTPSKEVNPQLAFPPFAAGGLCTTNSLSRFLIHLAIAYQRREGSGGIHHETARLMLGDSSLLDLGSMNFMGAKIGLGVFVAQAGNNKIMLHQAANDGFRGVYMLCFEGNDCGKGFLILANGDNPAVLFQSELARYLLGPKGLNFSGINFQYYEQNPIQFDMKSVTQESIVNKGLKDLVINAFIQPNTMSKL